MRTDLSIAAIIGALLGLFIIGLVVYGGCKPAELGGCPNEVMWNNSSARCHEMREDGQPGSFVDTQCCDGLGAPRDNESTESVTESP